MLDQLHKIKCLIFTVGNSTVGLGHLFNMLTLADMLATMKIRPVFMVDPDSDLAFTMLSRQNRPCFMQSHASPVSEIHRFAPDLLFNDILDTSAEFITAVKARGTRVINFEDLGLGAHEADLTINAIYEAGVGEHNHYWGHRYFLPRDEFLVSPSKCVIPQVREVLLSFGGVDPGNYTLKSLESIYGYCHEKQICIRVVLGPGYDKLDTLKKFPGIQIHRNATNMAELMLAADLVLCSAGRTLFEIACVGTPALIMAQNERESSHAFGSSVNGFRNLGLGSRVDHASIREAFVGLIEDASTRLRMNQQLLSRDVCSGRSRVLNLIVGVIKTIKRGGMPTMGRRWALDHTDRMSRPRTIDLGASCARRPRGNARSTPAT